MKNSPRRSRDVEVEFVTGVEVQKPDNQMRTKREKRRKEGSIGRFTGHE